VGQDVLTLEVLGSHSDRPQLAGLLWRCDQPIAQTSDYTQHSQETDIRAPSGIWTCNLSK